MKKLILLFLFMITGLTFAQVTYGLKAGMNMSKIKDIHTDSGQGFGLYAGGFATIPLQNYSQEFFIQPEVLFSVLGEKDGDEMVGLNYILLPILFKAYFSEQDTEFFGEIGPQFGLMLGQSLPDNYRYTHEFNTFDFGPTIGLGFSYLRTWEVSARFYYGMSDVIKGDPGEDKNFQSDVNFGLAYRF